MLDLGGKSPKSSDKSLNSAELTSYCPQDDRAKPPDHAGCHSRRPAEGGAHLALYPGTREVGGVPEGPLYARKGEFQCRGRAPAPVTGPQGPAAPPGPAGPGSPKGG